jgi:hypothetical protein
MTVLNMNKSILEELTIEEYFKVNESMNEAKYQMNNPKVILSKKQLNNAENNDLYNIEDDKSSSQINKT